MAATVNIGDFLKVEFSAAGLTDRFATARAVLEKPFAGSTGIAAIAAMRRGGAGSFAQQFAVESEWGMSGQKSWPKTKDFGTRKAPPKTLGGGPLQAAWLGGAGSLETVEQGGRAIAVGVSGSALPYAGVFQRTGPTIIRAKRKTKSGQYAMRIFLGLTFGVWITNDKAELGMVVMPRRLGVNRLMLGRIVELIVKDTVAASLGKPLPSASQRGSA
jgi:hypothetical protein